MQALFFILIAGIAFLAFFALHVSLWRMNARNKGLMLLLKCACAAYAFTAIAVYAAGLSALPQHMPVSLPCFLLFVLMYLHLYIGTFRSLSVRILNELAAAPDMRMTYAQLDAVYSKRSMFTSRVDILTEHGWIMKENDHYRCSPKGSFFARIIIWLRTLYGVQNAG